MLSHRLYILFSAAEKIRQNLYLQLAFLWRVSEQGVAIYKEMSSILDDQ